MTQLIDLFLHADRYLLDIVSTYGRWIYGLLFAIVFAETGLVVTPFLPGDSLLFAAGAIAASGALDMTSCGLVLLVAAITGDAVNYAIGRAVGARIIERSKTDRRWARWVNPRYIARAHEFFERHGGKAIVLGRFVPIVRTFVPFVAGAATMTYPTFALFNVVGGLAWVGLCLGAGYLFGNVPVVKNNFSLVALGIVFVSLLPMIIEYARYSRRSRQAAQSSRGPDVSRS
jgi:membrane-associated protein